MDFKKVVEILDDHIDGDSEEPDPDFRQVLIICRCMMIGFKDLETKCQQAPAQDVP